jgi:hypothetical protein
LRRALIDGREDLERLVGQPIDTIAYPHCEWSAEVAAAARDAGFRIGGTCEGLGVTASDDPLTLPRIDAAVPTFGHFILHLARATTLARWGRASGPAVQMAQPPLYDGDR